MGATISLGGAPAPYVLEVPLRAAPRGGDCCALPRATVPHSPADCPPALAQVVPPDEFAALMAQLDAVAGRQGMTHGAARHVQRRMGFVALGFFLVFVVSSISWTLGQQRTCSGSSRSSSSRGDCGPFGASFIVYVVALVAFIVVTAAGSCYARSLLVREQRAAQALREEAARLAPALAARGVSLDIGEAVQLGGSSRRLAVMSLTYTVRFGLPPGLMMVAGPGGQPVGMVALPPPPPGAYYPPGYAAAGYHPGYAVPTAVPVVGYAAPPPHPQPYVVGGAAAGGAAPYAQPLPPYAQGAYGGAQAYAHTPQYAGVPVAYGPPPGVGAPQLQPQPPAAWGGGGGGKQAA